MLAISLEAPRQVYRQAARFETDGLAAERRTVMDISLLTSLSTRESSSASNCSRKLCLDELVEELYLMRKQIGKVGSWRPHPDLPAWFRTEYKEIIKECRGKLDNLMLKLLRDIDSSVDLPKRDGNGSV